MSGKNMLMLATGAATAGAAYYMYQHGRFNFLRRELIAQSTTLDGTISLSRASEILNRWTTRGFIGSYIGVQWASMLYRAVADLAATRNIGTVLTERNAIEETIDDEDDGAGYDSNIPVGFEPATEGPGLVHNQVTGLHASASKPTLKVRRGQRRRAAHTLYNRIVSEIGLRPSAPGQLDVVMDYSVRMLKEMNVRLKDRPALMAEVQLLYSTPLEAQLHTAAVMRNSWHTRLRQEVADVR